MQCGEHWLFHPSPNLLGLGGQPGEGYEGEEIQLDAGEYTYYQWYTIDDSLISIQQILTVTDAGKFYIIVEDEKGCTNISELSIVYTVPRTELFVPSSFTPNNDGYKDVASINWNFKENNLMATIKILTGKMLTVLMPS